MTVTHSIGTFNGPAFHTGETVYCRFTGEAFTVVECNGCVATLSDDTTRMVGVLTRRAVDLAPRASNARRAHHAPRLYRYGGCPTAAPA